MKKFYLGLFFISAFLFLTGYLLAQGKSNTGRLDMKERVFNFGLVPRDAKVVHNFVLKNVGNDTLRILEIKPGCSCTTAPVDKKSIAVNDSTVMPVTFSTGKRSGNTTKGVNVTTDMEPRGLFPVSIEAFVESPTMNTPNLVAEPRSIEYTPPDSKTTGEIKITFTNGGNSEYFLRIIDYTHELGTPKLLKDRIKPGKSAELSFSFNPQLNYNTVYGSVTLEVTGEGVDYSRYTIPIVRNRPANYTTN